MELTFLNFKSAIKFIFSHFSSIEEYSFHFDKYDEFLFELFLNDENISFSNEKNKKSIYLIRKNDKCLINISDLEDFDLNLIVTFNNNNRSFLIKFESSKLLNKEENISKIFHIFKKNEGFKIFKNKLTLKLDNFNFKKVTYYEIEKDFYRFFIIYDDENFSFYWKNYLKIFNKKFKKISGIYCFSKNNNFLLEGFTNVDKSILIFDKSLFLGQSNIIEGLFLNKTNNELRVNNKLFELDSIK